MNIKAKTQPYLEARARWYVVRKKYFAVCAELKAAKASWRAELRALRDGANFDSILIEAQAELKHLGIETERTRVNGGFPALKILTKEDVKFPLISVAIDDAGTFHITFNTIHYPLRLKSNTFNFERIAARISARIAKAAKVRVEGPAWQRLGIPPSE